MNGVGGAAARNDIGRGTVLMTDTETVRGTGTEIDAANETGKEHTGVKGLVPEVKVVIESATVKGTVMVVIRKTETDDENVMMILPIQANTESKKVEASESDRRMTMMILPRGIAPDHLGGIVPWT